MHPIGMAGEGGELAASDGIPDLEGVVGGAGDDAAAVRGPSQGIPGRMAGEGGELAAGSGVPDFEGVVD